MHRARIKRKASKGRNPTEREKTRFPDFFSEQLYLSSSFNWTEQSISEMEDQALPDTGEVTTSNPENGRKLSETTQSAVLNVLYNNLQKAIIDCVAKGSSLVLSVADSTPKLQSLPGRAVVNIQGDVQIVNLSKDIRNILMNKDVYLKVPAAADSTTPDGGEDENEGVEFRKEINLEPLAKADELSDEQGSWNCLCMHCGSTFSRVCPTFKAQVDAKLEEERKARKKRPYRPDLKRSAKVECKYCGKIVTNQTIKHHLKAHEGVEYQCRFCPKKFKIPFSRARHEKLHFIKRKEIYCEHCQKVFYNQSALNVHLNTKHRNMQRHFCDICGKGWYFAHQVTIHRRVHTGEQPFVCQHCGRGFRLNHQLQSHLKQHDPERAGKRKSSVKSKSE